MSSTRLVLRGTRSRRPTNLSSGMNTQSNGVDEEVDCLDMEIALDE